MVAAVFSLLGYGALTTEAVGPGIGQVAQLSAETVSASLSYSGDEAIITGSVDHIFESNAFVGPNRGDKRDRERITADVTEFATGFDAVRARLAALRLPDPSSLLQSHLAATGLLSAEPTPEAAAADDVDRRISVAAIDPAIGSSALDAISTVDQSVPMPVIASEQLAYGRANTPVTDLTEPESQYAEKELWCLATAVYFEARGEAYRGQVAVAQVVMNRVAHRLYPDTICGVVFQNQQKRNACQFSFACDGRPETITDQKSWTQAQEIARGVTSGELYLTEVANSTHYHATYVYPHWAPRLKKMTKIGLHVFYRFKRG